MPKFLPNEFLALAVRSDEPRQPAPAHSASAAFFPRAGTDPSRKETGHFGSLLTLAAKEGVDCFTNGPFSGAGQTLRVSWEEIAEQPHAVAVRFDAEPGVRLEEVRPTGLRHQGIND